jgi:hypothetical protein
VNPTKQCQNEQTASQGVQVAHIKHLDPNRRLTEVRSFVDGHVLTRKGFVSFHNVHRFNPQRYPSGPVLRTAAKPKGGQCQTLEALARRASESELPVIQSNLVPGSLLDIQTM